MKILVVHRQKTTVDTIKSVLSGLNPVVRHAVSGLDGLLTSRIEHFDLIICGTELPVVTGFELIRSVRTHSVNTATPVIFITENSNEKNLRLAEVLGVSTILPEDEMPSRLTEIVQTFAWPDKKLSR